ncbi:MAG: hypothetical protein HY002_06715 [Candidatus Rokubacteria bacterium]|nr:hypothetical protein [Candidatus Rokubacteria bacterium]
MTVALGASRMHPWLNLNGDMALVGRMTDAGAVELVTSERLTYSPDDELMKPFLVASPRPYPDLAGRWRDEDVAAFRADAEAPSIAEVLALIVHALDRHMEFPRREHRTLVAVWALATYFFLAFVTFPRLALSGEPESGKSKLLELLRAFAWNALLIITPTPAVLFRLAQEFRPTLLLDEMEKLGKEDTREILAILNSGYKVGACVPRVEGERARHVEPFAVYGPLAFAAIKATNLVTESRCIPLVLLRGVDKAKINAEVDPNADLFARIRAECYRLLLARWRDVAAASHAVAFPEWLNGRARELWKPLFALAELADAEGLSLTSDLHALARRHVRDRQTVSTEAEALLPVLEEQLGAAGEIKVYPGKLAEPLQLRLGWRDLTPETVGGWLRRLGFQRGGKDREGAWYRITTQALRDVMTRLAPVIPEDSGA